MAPGEIRERPEIRNEPVDEPKRELAGLIEEAVAEQTGIVDWIRKDDVKREMRRKIKRLLKDADYTPEHREMLAQTIIQILQARTGH